MAAGPIPPSARSGGWEQDLSTDGATTDWYVPAVGDFTAGVRGTWVGSVKFQRSFDGGTTGIDYTILDQAFAPTANFSTDLGQSEKNVLWRAVFTRTSGTATVRFGQ